MKANLLRLRCGAAVRLQVLTCEPDPQNLAATAREVRDWFDSGAIATQALARSMAMGETYVLVATRRGDPVWIPESALATDIAQLVPTVSGTAAKHEGAVSVVHAMTALGSHARTDFLPIAVTGDEQWVQIGIEVDQVLFRRWDAALGEGIGPTLCASIMDVLEKLPGPQSSVPETELGSPSVASVRQLELRPDDSVMVFELLARLMRRHVDGQQVDFATHPPMALDSLSAMGASATEIDEQNAAPDARHPANVARDSSAEGERSVPSYDVLKRQVALGSQTVALPIVPTHGESSLVGADPIDGTSATAGAIPLGIVNVAAPNTNLNQTTNEVTCAVPMVATKQSATFAIFDECGQETSGTHPVDVLGPTPSPIGARMQDGAFGARKAPAAPIVESKIDVSTTPSPGEWAGFDSNNLRHLAAAPQIAPCEPTNAHLEMEHHRTTVFRAVLSEPTQSRLIGSLDSQALASSGRMNETAEGSRNVRAPKIAADAFVGREHVHCEDAPTAVYATSNQLAGSRRATAAAGAASRGDTQNSNQSTVAHHPPHRLEARDDDRDRLQRAESLGAVDPSIERTVPVVARVAPKAHRPTDPWGAMRVSSVGSAVSHRLDSNAVEATRLGSRKPCPASENADFATPALAFPVEMVSHTVVPPAPAQPGQSRPGEVAPPIASNGRSAAPKLDDNRGFSTERHFTSRIRLDSSISPTVGARERAIPVPSAEVGPSAARQLGAGSKVLRSQAVTAALPDTQRQESVWRVASDGHSSRQFIDRAPLATPVDSLSAVAHPVAAVSRARSPVDELTAASARAVSPAISAPSGAAAFSLRHCAVARAVEIGEIVVDLGSPEAPVNTPTPRTGSLIAAIPLARVSRGRR